MQADAVLARVETVCPFPGNLARVVQLTGGDADMQEVAEAIAMDAGMAAEVLRLANGVGRGAMRRIDTLEQAVVNLGMAELHAMATAMGMLVAVASEHELSTGLHERALVAALIARRVAPDANIDKRVAFLAALLCEIGAMACLAVDADAYASILLRTDGDLAARARQESARYGTTSHALGGALLDRNGLPDHVVEGVCGRGTVGALTSYARSVAVMLEHVADDDCDAISSGDLGDRFAAVAAEHALEVERFALVLGTLDAAGVADKAWNQ